MSRRLVLLLVGVLLALGVPVAAQPDVPPPYVRDILPLPGVPLTAGAPLTITFSQPMQTAALAFEPDVAGSITWPDVLTLTFAPDEGWPTGANYAVTLTATAQSGVDLAEPVTFDLGWGILHVVFMKDPDGFIIELVQSPVEIKPGHTAPSADNPHDGGG